VRDEVRRDLGDTGGQIGLPMEVRLGGGEVVKSNETVGFGNLWAVLMSGQSGGVPLAQKIPP